MRIVQLSALLLLPLLCLPAAPAQAQEEDGASAQAKQIQRRSLADRIPAVSNRAFAKEGRLEVAPAVGSSLSDPFYRHVTAGGGLTFHVLESLAVGASGEYYLSLKTAPQISGGGTHRMPSYNRPQYAARLDVTWAPLYGKLSLMAEQVLHFDTYIGIAAGVVGPTKTSPTFATGFTLGQHYVVSEWFALKLELRDQIFQLARNPKQNKDANLQNLLTVTFGMCFYLPTEVERERI